MPAFGKIVNATAGVPSGHPDTVVRYECSAFGRLSRHRLALIPEEGRAVLRRMDAAGEVPTRKLLDAHDLVWLVDLLVDVVDP